MKKKVASIEDLRKKKLEQFQNSGNKEEQQSKKEKTKLYPITAKPSFMENVDSHIEKVSKFAYCSNRSDFVRKAIENQIIADKEKYDI